MPALSTLSSRLRDRIPHLSCAIIKSGTSRFVVLREEELPTQAPGVTPMLRSAQFVSPSWAIASWACNR